MTRCRKHCVSWKVMGRRTGFEVIYIHYYGSLCVIENLTYIFRLIFGTTYYILCALDRRDSVCVWYRFLFETSSLSGGQSLSRVTHLYTRSLSLLRNSDNTAREKLKIRILIGPPFVRSSVERPPSSRFPLQFAILYRKIKFPARVFVNQIIYTSRTSVWLADEITYTETIEKGGYSIAAF